MRTYSRSSNLRSVAILQVLVLVLVSLVVGCTKSAENRRMDPNEAFGMFRNRFAVILDVREKEELNEGMAAGALWMPFSKIASNDAEWQSFKDSKLSADKTTIIYCGSGARAEKVAKMLNQDGFNTGVIGGFNDWKKAELPVEPRKF